MSKTGDMVARAKAYLYQLGTEEVEPLRSWQGICWHLNRVTGITIHLSSDVWDDWPHYSGIRAYPLPGGEEAFIENGDLWHGEQGKLRRDLCLFLADNLKPHQIY